MKDIGFYGNNLQAASRKVLNAKTPEEKTFRRALIKNDEARAVVDKVDFVQRTMSEIDGKGLDTDGAKGDVAVDGQAKKLGKFGRFLGAANKPLEAITTQAPPAEQAPKVSGTLKDGNLKVDVEHAPDKTTTFAKTTEESGKVVYQAGSDLVTMNADGTLSMGTVDAPAEQPWKPGI